MKVFSMAYEKVEINIYNSVFINFLNSSKKAIKCQIIKAPHLISFPQHHSCICDIVLTFLAAV